MYLLIQKEDVCMAKYTSLPNLSYNNHIICGSCNLSFIGKNYIKYYTSKTKYRYISNCPQCGKWNKIKV